MQNIGKKRHVVSYENMSAELLDAFKEKYPQGPSDCLVDLVKYPKPDGSSFYAVTLEVPDGIYLVKIKVDVDDADDVERWLDGEDDDYSGGSSDAGDDNTIPDDNISQYGSDDDPADEA